MNVCLFGGTFDPVHLGHEYIISKLLSKFDKIIIIPSKKSPAKKQNPIANSSSRLEMLSLCEFANNEKCIISNFELESDTLTNYTIHTIKWVDSQFPKSKIYLAIGLDQLENFSSWHKSKEILSIVDIVCFNRYELANDIPEIKCNFIEDFNHNISSSEIRSLIRKKDKKVKDMINKSVMSYIFKNQIYK